MFTSIRLCKCNLKHIILWQLTLASLITLSLISSICLAKGYNVKAIKHLYDITTAGGQALSLPSDVAVDAKHIFVVDGTNNRIVAFDLSGHFLYNIGGQGKDKDFFSYPVGITVQNNKIYIADTGHHSVKILNISGKLIRSINIVSEGKKERPIDLVVSNNGKELYVTANNTHRVQVYSPNGKLIRSWGGRGESDGKFRYPATISAFGRDKKVIVDVLNSRIQIFTNSGKFVQAIGKLGVVAGKFFRPKGVTVDSKGYIYVSDSYIDVIQVFDNFGDFIYLLGNNDEIQRFTHPTGIVIHNNRLYVTETLENKVSVYSLI